MIFLIFFIVICKLTRDLIPLFELVCCFLQALRRMLSKQKLIGHVVQHRQLSVTICPVVCLLYLCPPCYLA